MPEQNTSPASNHEANTAPSESNKQQSQSFNSLWSEMTRQGELHAEQSRQDLAASMGVWTKQRVIYQSVNEANEALSKWGIIMGVLSLTTVGMSRVGVRMQGTSTSDSATSAGKQSASDGVQETTGKYDHDRAGTTLFGDPVCQVDFAHDATSDDIVEAVKKALDQAGKRFEVIEVQRS